jgi:short-subunit dehydrogenase
MSSMAGLLGSANLGAYFASKHAVEGMAKCLREEMKPWSIHVSNVNPAYMRTPILTSGLEAAQKAFDAAPKDITSEYDTSFIQWHSNVMNRTAEDPSLVVDELVSACTDRRPEMWYFPGVMSSVMRVMPVCSSLLTDVYVWIGSAKGIPQPTAAALKKYRA